MGIKESQNAVTVTIAIPGDHDIRVLLVKRVKPPHYQLRRNFKFIVFLALLVLSIFPTLAEEAGESNDVDNASEDIDDDVINLNNAHFDGMTYMPVSCVN